MSKYRAIVYFYFKAGKAKNGLQILENELLDIANKEGCLESEIALSEQEPNTIIGMGLWANFSAAQDFENKFDKIVEKLMPFLEKRPVRKLWKVSDKSFYAKMKKAA